MSNEIKDGLDAALPPGGVPVSLDVDSVVSSGRRARRRRGKLRGGAFLSVLAAGALTVTLMGMGVVPPEDDDTVALPDTAADDGGVPVLDPEKDYYWGTSGDPHEGGYGSSPYGQLRNETSRALSDAFWSYLTANHPGVTLWENVGYSGEEPINKGWEELPGEPAKLGDVQQHTKALFEGTENFDGPPPIENLVFEQTSYGIYQFSKSSAMPIGGLDLRFADRADGPIADDRVVLDLVSFEAYPAGSHAEGTGDALDLVRACEDHVECEMADIEGPDGEGIRALTAYGQWSENGPTDSIVSHRVVLYKEDGSAIVLSNTLSLDTAEYEEDPVPPALSIDRLVEFAVAMSKVKIA